MFQFVTRKDEGKLQRLSIPDDVVIDKSGANTFHTLLYKNEYKIKGPAWLLENMDDEQYGLKIDENDWIHINGKVCMLPY